MLLVVNVFLSIKVFSVAKMFNFLLAFSQIVLKWSFHVRFEFISIPRCLCFVTVSKSELLNVRGNSMVSLFFFKKIVRALLKKFGAMWDSKLTKTKQQLLGLL